MSDSLIVTLTSFLSHDNCGHVGSIKVCDCETCSHCIAPEQSGATPECTLWEQPPKCSGAQATNGSADTSRSADWPVKLWNSRPCRVGTVTTSSSWPPLEGEGPSSLRKGPPPQGGVRNPQAGKIIPSSLATKVNEIGQQALVDAESAKESQDRKKAAAAMAAMASLSQQDPWMCHWPYWHLR